MVILMSEIQANPIEVRPANFSDAQPIIDLYPEIDRKMFNFIQRAVSSRNCYVGLINKQQHAFGIMEYDFFDFAFIHSLYVAPDARRQGLATALIRFMELNCKSGKLFTRISQSNLPGHTLLKKMNYLEAGEISNLYDNANKKDLFYYKPLN